MPVDVMEITDQEKMEKETTGESAVSRAKRGRVKKCKVCGMSTYQKEGLCVICKTGIREASKALAE